MNITSYEAQKTLTG